MRRLAPALLLVLGCTQDNPFLSWPEIGAAQSGVLVFGRQLEIVEPCCDVLELDVPNGTTPIELAFSDESLPELLLQPSPDGTGTRRLPASFDRHWTSSLSGADVEAWESSIERPPGLSALRFEAFDHATCAQNGGCWSAGESRCRQDCAPTPPESPEAPRVSCPPNWSAEDSGYGVPLCDRPHPVVPTCTGSERAAVDSESCRTVGTPCPSDGWPESVDTATVPVLYVDPTASPGGNGAKAAPYSTIAEALANAPSPTIIALAAATYTEPVRLDTAGVRIVGACPAETVLTDDAGAVNVVVQIRAPDVRLENLSVTGGARGIQFLAGATQRASLSDLVIEDATVGVRLEGAHATLDRVVIRGTSTSAVHVLLGGTVRLEDSALDSQRLGLLLQSASSAVLENVVIAASTPDATRGISADSQSQLTVRNAVLQQIPESGIFLAGQSSADVEDIVSQSSGPSGAKAGTAITVLGNSQLVLRRAALRDSRTITLAVKDGSSVDATEVAVRDVGTENETKATHFDVVDGAVVIASQIWATGGGRVVVFSLDTEDGRIEVSDLLAINEQGTSSMLGSAFLVPGGRVAVRRALVRGAWSHGVRGTDNTMFEVLEDLDFAGQFSAGLTIPSVATVERVSLEGAREAFDLDPPSTGPFVKFILRDITIRCPDEGQGAGIFTKTRTDLDLERFVISDCGTQAIFLGAPIRFSAREGRIGNNAVGIIGSEEFDLISDLHNVLFENNATTIRRQ